jgi:uncharacterized membrane protein YfcA
MTIFGVPAVELAVLAAAILIAGALAGFFAGLLGIGGAALIVPVLYEVFRLLGVPDEVRFQLCVGTSLGFIVPTSLRSFFAHRAKGAVRVDVLRLWAVPVMLGVLVGAFVAYVASSAALKLIYIVFTVLMALRMLFGRETWRLGDRLPNRPGTITVGFVIGLVSALMGVGGGAFSALFLVLYGQTIHVAVATSSGVGVFISIPGTIGYMLAGWPQQALMPPFSVGYVSFLGLLLFAPVSVLVAPYGAKIAHRWSRRRLEVAFGIFLVLVAIRFLWSLLP